LRLWLVSAKCLL